MRLFYYIHEVYLPKRQVDFRKSINGLVALVEHTMAKSPFSGALYVFCNQRADKLKVVYWDQTGFCLWYKRLEKNRLAWPKSMHGEVLTLTEEQFPRCYVASTFHACRRIPLSHSSSREMSCCILSS